MPIIVKETSWRQTPAKVFILVPLNNVPTQKVDVFTSERYIKLHYGNYIFEKLLLHPVDEEASTIRLVNNEAEFELNKIEEVMWDTLEMQVTKKEAIDLKIKLMEEHREKVKQKAEEVSSKKDKRSKEAVTVQLKLDTDEQSTVKQLREQQKWEALSGNYATGRTYQNSGDIPTANMRSHGNSGLAKGYYGHLKNEEKERNSVKTEEDIVKEIKKNGKLRRDGNESNVTNNATLIDDKKLLDIDRTHAKTHTKDICNVQYNDPHKGFDHFEEMHKGTSKSKEKLERKAVDAVGGKNMKDHDDEHKGVIITELTDEDVERINKEKEQAQQVAAAHHKELMERITRQVRARIQAEEARDALPIVRSQGQVGVTFTPRVFPTPMRESMAPEEEEWLKKQAAARQACGFIAADLRPEENNPDWVKAKGDEMFKQGNYLGAVSAYSHGLKLCPNLASLYSNRAAAHIAMNNLHKAADDASEAIKLLTPPCEANRKSRIQAHVRRATALCGLKVPKLGLLDFEAALALSPNDEKLREDTKRARELAERPDDDSAEIDLSSPPLIVTR